MMGNGFEPQSIPCPVTRLNAEPPSWVNGQNMERETFRGYRRDKKTLEHSDRTNKGSARENILVA